MDEEGGREESVEGGVIICHWMREGGREEKRVCGEKEGYSWMSREGRKGGKRV